MFTYIKKCLGLIPTQEEANFIARVNDSWKTLQVSPRGRVSVDINEILADEAYLKQVRRFREILDDEAYLNGVREFKEAMYRKAMDIRQRPATVAIGILRGSSITQKEADELIETIRLSTIPE